MSVIFLQTCLSHFEIVSESEDSENDVLLTVSIHFASD
jgi:hypothetical protein